MNQKYFILHGHFYQPPRENPWTGFLDRQPSAYPYNDWNTRINLECYSSCTQTSIWDNNQVVSILNCYEYLSFNFGPTLLSWMEKKDADPNTLKKIIEADKISAIRNSGHGNAIAQVYNHMIMPLANEKDQYTQVLWGLQDFKMRFGRDSEGLWLGETAINNETAAILVDCGVKFVILSPFQAQTIINGTESVDVSGGKVDSSRPYKLNTKHGDLAVFFYDPVLASGISFGDLLADSNNLHNAVRDAFNGQTNDVKLVHTATDGEVYGHHKAYGNMALARMIYDISGNSNPEFHITNYGKFLADHPPVQECILNLGDDQIGSSWSCVHGVGRWFRDCGCHTGGDDNWNQKWRTPVRNAFDYLRDQIHLAAEAHTKELLKDIWKARNEYLKALQSHHYNGYDEFFTVHQARPLNAEERRSIIEIMSSMHYAMLMYTSCGWFFADVSGIETVQDMLYAYRAYEFAKDILDSEVYEKFLQILSEAQSNVDSTNDGKKILEKGIAESYLSVDTLREYVCWFVLREGFKDIQHTTNEFVFEEIWEDPEQDRYVLNFRNNLGLETHTAFCLINEKNDKESWSGHLGWKDIDVSDEESFKKEEFWMQDNSWKVSNLSSIPLPLRIRFITRGIQYEMMRGQRQRRSEGSLSLEVVWGVESLLLPYEKRILVFYYASQVHKFAQNLAFGEPLSHSIDVFLREAELLKKSASSVDEAKLYLEPVALVLEIYLKKALVTQNLSMLKDARIIYWGIKDRIAPKHVDQLRSILYEFYKGSLQSQQNLVFIVEFKSIMKDMDFATWMIN